MKRALDLSRSGLKGLFRIASICFFFLGTTAATLANDGSQATCQAIFAAIQRYQSIAQEFARARDLYPGNPLERGLYLRKALGEQAVAFALEPEREVVRDHQTSHGAMNRQVVSLPARLSVVVNGQYHRNIQPIPLLGPDALNTMMYVGRADLAKAGRMKINTLQIRDPERGGALTTVGIPVFQPREKSRAIVSWAHGLTGLYSQSARMREQLDRMNVVHTKGPIAETLNDPKTGNWIPVSAVAIDHPIHGAGTLDPAMFELPKVLAYEDAWYRYLAGFNKPVVAASRSGSNLIMGQLNYLYSKSGQKQNPLRGMIWMGPMHPAEGYNEALKGYKKEVDAGAVINPMGFRWYESISNQLIKSPEPWWESANPLGESPTPLLVLVGEKDKETPRATREAYKRLSERFPDHIFYVEIPEVGHDVFAVTETFSGDKRRWSPEAERRAAMAWSYVYWFLRRHVEGDPSAVLPPYGLLHRR